MKVRRQQVLEGFSHFQECLNIIPAYDLLQGYIVNVLECHAALLEIEEETRLLLNPFYKVECEFQWSQFNKPHFN